MTAGGCPSNLRSRATSVAPTVSTGGLEGDLTRFIVVEEAEGLQNLVLRS